LLGSVGKGVPDHGMVSAMIRLTNNGCNGDTIWPAFWLVASNHGAWPGCGEIDIAERQGGTTATHLIGAGDAGRAFVDDNMITYGSYPGKAMFPDGQYRKYAFEWNFHSGNVDFTSWLDDQWMGSQTCGPDGGSGHDLTCSINYNAVKKGYHMILFDVDTHGSGSDKYSMSVKDVSIKEITSSAVLSDMVIV